MIISFDLSGILCLIVLPSIILFLCYISYGFSKEIIARRDLKWREKRNFDYKEEIRLRNEIYELKVKLKKLDENKELSE